MVSAEPPQSEVSSPINRIRWATRRATGEGGVKKRESLIRRWHQNHRRTPSAEKKAGRKRSSTVETTETATDSQSQKVDSDSLADLEVQRRVFFNIPLPDDARDEDGKPVAHFARNKIRTAKYTPLSFFPKNLWFQFHNIANIYFLFIIILGVSPSPSIVTTILHDDSPKLIVSCNHSSSKFLVPLIQASTPFL
jgi:phospholipid-translocating ATPase